jgi:hypothetical protein
MWDATTERKVGDVVKADTRMNWAFPPAIRKSTHQQEMKITFHNGSTIQLVGSDNFNSLVGSPPVGLVFSEYSISNPSSWAYLMPILEENNGWACFNGTPRGKNHFQKICIMAEDRDDWFYDSRTVDDTAVFNTDQLQRIRAELHDQYGPDFGEAIFLQEYYVSFEAAIIGAIWADCVEKLRIQGKICDVPYDPQYPVHCSYDIGKSDATAIWFFQIVGQEINLIDYHESNHKDVPFYCQLLRDKTTELGYRYATHWLPHDAWHDTLASGGKTVVQQFVDNGKDGRIGKFKRVPSVSRQDGIQAARATFPRCNFDAKRCGDGLEALRSYHHKYDDVKKIFSNDPDHDWASNGSDSFRYLSLVWKEARAEPALPPVDEMLIKHGVTNIKMGTLTKQHFARMKAAREN